ncbi:uncharacterized protein BP5553_05224 [Venustampulla echinocandica]|uniref:C2H2-type domain-containing protein n=1 Tax=Venustampulla echinocandica TaxID=2656787 RepID=A0A370TQI6_9HELO|nr:uncharacterized protein BP5553_05224 [Venustampulla echinocandica]RDL37791.1 hypothetical protein BP5553_05224 [Venustampulla echinocandica]
MDIPSRGPRLPEIYVHDSSTDRFRTSSRSSSYTSSSSATSAIPMSIPNARDPVPPPLPPPKHLPDIASGGNNGPDLAWRYGNMHSDYGSSGSSVAPGSSLYGSFASRKTSMDDRPDYSRRTDSTATIKGDHGREQGYPRDEGYSSLSGTSIESFKSKFQNSPSTRSTFQSSIHDKFQSNTQAYDKSLLQKLDSRRTNDSKTPPRSYSKLPTFSSSANDVSPTRRAVDHIHPTQLKPLSLPILGGRLDYVESPIALSQYGDTPLSSAVSPRNPFPRVELQTQFDYRSPRDVSECDRSPHPYVRGSGSSSAMSVGDDTSSVTSRRRESYDRRVSPDHDVDFHMEEAGLRRLNIDDYAARSDPYSPGATTSLKRRASSPPVEDGPSLHTVGSASDLFRRRESASRCSPTPRLHSTSGSVSSAASGARNNSYSSSTLSIGTGSITSMSSYGRLSPGGVSPGSTDVTDSPYVSSISLNTSPRGSYSNASQQRNISEARLLISSREMADSMGNGKLNGIPKIQGVFMCECCPKKPKKFDTQEDLDGHEQEKQYQCAYCHNRFKNKNEAERHQNSLHLRRHSWSCAALSGYPAAFHASSSRPNEADTCGYCGEDFPRSGISSPSAGPQVAIATERDWNARIAHLQEMHKFGECNHAKKFFRADHFRQHLKHSHAGTSGKWTNMLENACMKDEPLPEPIRGPERVVPGSGRVSRITEEEENP